MNTNRMKAVGGARHLLALLAATLLASLLLTQAARADFGVSLLDVALTDAAGNPATQAAGHPNLTVKMSFNSVPDPNGGPIPVADGSPRTIALDLPKGFYGNPGAVPQCARPLLAANPFASDCPANTMIGMLAIHGTPNPDDPPALAVPVYNVETSDGEAAVFAANLYGAPVNIVSTVGNDGVPHIRTTIRNVNQGLNLFGFTFTLWGVPADPSHDADRGGASTMVARPLLTAPSDCSRTLVTNMRAVSWQEPGRWAESKATLPAPTGCDQLTVSHDIGVTPTNPKADTPSGYDITLDVPQEDRPTHLGTAPLKRVEVKLPEGVAISPAAASAVGLAGCTDEQLAVGTDAEPSCPSASKIGDVAIQTPLLKEAVEGPVYLGAPTPDAMFRIFLVARASGVLLKIPGTIHPDTATGQLTAVFDDLPELPFDHLTMHLKGGDTAPLANPQSCGTKTATSTITAWAGAQSTADGSFAISGDGQGGACPGVQPFAPTFQAGMTDSGAGLFSAFTMTVRRSDGDQELKSIAVALPPGLLGILSGIPQCPEAAAAAGTCDATTQLGTVTVESGSGSKPLPLTGRVFLTGAYKGSPYGLAIVVRAVAGPFDLGTVVVRAPLNIDAAGAKVAVPADDLPTILQGVPLRLRTINITLDRPGFMFNATSCATSAVGATLTSVGGASVTPSSRYQVTGCAGLPLSPSFGLRLTGGVRQLRKNGHPGVQALLGQDAGESGLKAVAVTLPAGVSVDLKNLGSICEAADAAARKCADSAIIGQAAAKTPALPTDLAGPVYLVEGAAEGSASGRLPRLWLKLEGSGVPLDLWANTAIVGSRLVTTFPAVPDAPISGFRLEINGGASGILQTARDQCTASRTMPVQFDGQNGKVLRRTVKATTDCAPRISKTKATKSTVALEVSGIGAGKLSASGSGVRKVSRSVKRADVATVTVKLTAKAKRTLARKGSLRLRLKVVYQPATGNSVTLHKSVTIRAKRR